MKNVLFSVIVLILASCTKEGSPKTSGYSCSCVVTWNGGAKDSSISFTYGNISRDIASSNCEVDLKKLQAKYGYGTAATSNQWVICDLK